MRILIIASLIAAQVAVAPAAAASFGDEPAAGGRRETSTFAGARLRLPLGGKNEKLRAGLLVAPMQNNRNADGRTRLRFGEGVEFGIAGDRAVGLSLAGRPLSAFASRAGQKIDKNKAKGVSTLGAVGIGAGVLLALGVAYVVVLTSQCYECDD